MTGTGILNVLLGAALVAIGVLASALADRIRGLRVTRERERTSRVSAVSSSGVRGVPATPAQDTPYAARRAIPVVEAPKQQPKAPRTEPKATASTEGGDDVIYVLMEAGYKKLIATEATWACSAAERATVEIWTAAALRRCARGGMS